MMPMHMQPPQKQTWEEIRDQLEISIANSEKNLLLIKAQLKEVESHIEQDD